MRAIPLIQARIGCVHRSGPLTPYLAELILDDVRRSGPGGRVEIRLAANADQAALEAVDTCLAPLRRQGVVIVCRRTRRADGCPDAAA